MNKTLLRVGSTVGLALFGAGALVACSSADPLDNSGGSDGGSALVVGSQDYYSNEIIAEIYAQALEAGGYDVDRQMRIGQREVYMPEIEDGKIDVFPEYTGNLLQYLDADATATESQAVYDALAEAMPDGVRVLEQSSASDQDSYVVTKSFADENGLTSIADLAGIDGLTLGGNSELEVRPYGPKGLKSVYGVDVAFTPIEDSGGPLTVKALRDDQVQLVDLYSADPALASGDLVTLEDPEGLFLASQVVPVVSDAVDDDAAAIINKVSAALTAEDLVALNAQSVDDESPAATIAEGWLADNDLG
ncbi:glycine/betaine ABC transporter permease [Microbacterium sorbitolivorans]|uniref:Glycine/betaine ABC transporter n=1 Tax=Microbacterium sorbitolivorans TaxID=1867410 RepID=A0A367Y3X3_9MICO|nr:ABC transporter substrate-binding protein [Microbacterium sorbitolivorans]RCK60260.1 glycine/betaine ABC transporter [Microbacterium sorbitolivorans]GGF42060.1 glycine/betaine ABC transporter permease [Microbacterium sorbitolivorans]